MPPPTPPGKRSSERGYSLAVVIGILTVMAIALGAALKHWVAAAEREREKELISRGFQYAEAIRVFQRRFGRLPNQLEELVEIEPRSIRRLWDDPMGDDGGWLVLIEAPGGQIVPLDPETGEIVGGSADEEPSTTAERAPTGRRNRRAQAGSTTAGAIHGVKSRASRDAYHELFGSRNVGNWEFTVERGVPCTVVARTSRDAAAKRRGRQQQPDGSRPEPVENRTGGNR
jgi:type II secretory pathway pseudopilin PulG